MNYKKLAKLVLIVFFILTLASCSNSPIKFTTNEGSFSRSKSDFITVDHKVKSNQGFFASLDFDLKVGKVDWEIIGPENKSVFKGYVIYENGNVYRELTYPLNFLGGYLNSKQEVKNDTDANGNTIHIPDFNYLQFGVGSPSGAYKLNLQPINAEGSYKVIWSNKLTRK